VRFPLARVRLRALAKINLDLRVLHRRGDGFHEIRTIFHSISLADRIEVELQPARRAQVEAASNVGIADNLAARAAAMALEEMRVAARVSLRLDKRIPIGAGLGGGSSDAAAMLMALPAMAGRPIGEPRVREIAAELGADVGYFLHGGAAMGLGRGGELYPLPSPGALHGLLIAPRLHVSTAEAYRALRRPAREMPAPPAFTALSAALAARRGIAEWAPLCANDFEEAVFERHPELRRLKRRLLRTGASPALMTGSGSALYGLYASRRDAVDAARSFPRQATSVFRLVSAARYRAMWRRSLGAIYQASS
jgi:4-diphosphocytidyl-2-C-methyl-D-erythritol kinase